VTELPAKSQTEQDIRSTLAAWGERDGAALAAAIQVYSHRHLHWIMGSFTGLPDGPTHDQAASLYPMPFPSPSSLDSTGSIGASEILTAACAEHGADPASIESETRVSLVTTYLHFHLEGWVWRMRRREEQDLLAAAEAEISIEERRVRRHRIIGAARAVDSLAFSDQIIDTLHHEFPFLEQLKVRAHAGHDIDMQAHESDDNFSAVLDCPVSTETQLAEDAYQAALKAVVYGHKF
jgi:hypothetical protein